MPEKIPMTTVPDDFSLRLKNKFPMLQNFTERPFGVEIEFFGMDYVITPLDNGIIKPYCISSRGKNGCHIQELCQDYNLLLGTSKDSWHIQQDTSVRGKCHIKHGAELTSPILSGIEGLVQVYQAFRFLSDVEGLDIDESCGFHVHHGVDPAVYNCNQLQRLVTIVKHYEDHFYQLIPGNRQNAKTCRPMELDVNAFLDVRDGDSAARNCPDYGTHLTPWFFYGTV